MESALSPVEKSVIIGALYEQIASDRKEAEAQPKLADYAKRNIDFRQSLIEKVEAL